MVTYLLLKYLWNNFSTDLFLYTEQQFEPLVGFFFCFSSDSHSCDLQ